MGIPGLWNELRPYGHRTDVTADLSERVKTLTDLQGKILAIDLSFWICENVGTYNHPVMGRLSDAVAKPHLRNVFYRTVKLISRVGALPVFVVDGDAPSLKMQTRLKRYHAQHQMQAPDRVVRAQGGAVRRNYEWEYKVQETVDLLRLMGLPVIYARAEAEALCAQLNAAGHVDACVSPDSDAFLYGARTLIKELAADLKKPIVDRYEAVEIAERLGLRRAHLVALAMLLGCDFDEKGVEGCGPKQGIKLVSGFKEDEILDRLRAWGRGEAPTDAEMFGEDEPVGQSQSATSSRPIHCGTCGHPGKVVEHRKGGCDGCGTEGGECTKKGRGFQCQCEWCVQARVGKARQKQESWWGKICDKIARQSDFPNEDIIEIFMRDDPRSLSHLKGGQRPLDQLLVWDPPDLDGLAKFMTAKCEESEEHWQLKALPLATAHYLSQIMAARLHREMVSDLGCLHRVGALVAPPGLQQLSPDDLLLDSSFKPSKVERIKVDASEALYRIQWRRVAGDSAGRSDVGTNQAGGGLVSDEADGEEEAEERDEDGEQGPEADDEGPKKVVLKWRKASGFSTDERKLMVQLAFPTVAGPFEEALAEKVRAKAQKEAEKEARKKEREEKAALKQTNIKSFFVTKKGGARFTLPTGGAFPAADKGGAEGGAKGGAQKLAADQGGSETTAEVTGDPFRSSGDSIRTGLWPGSSDGEPFRTSGKRSDMSLRGGDGSFAEDDAGPSDRIDQRTQFDRFKDAGRGSEELDQLRTERGPFAQKKRQGLSQLVEEDADAAPDAPKLDADASWVAPQLGADASSDGLPGTFGRRASLLEQLPESPFMKHPERRAGFEKLAELQRRLATLDPGHGGVTSAIGGVASAGGAGDLAAPYVHGVDRRELRREKGKEKLEEQFEGRRLVEFSENESEGEGVADEVRRRDTAMKGARKTTRGGTESSVGLLGTWAMPVEIDDSPPRRTRKATRVGDSDRPTTPVRRSPSEGSPGQGSPVTPSKRRAEDCLVEHTPPKRLADQFDRVKGGEEAVEKSSAKRLVFSSGLSGDFSARGVVAGAKQSQGDEVKGFAGGGGNEKRRERSDKQDMRGKNRTKGSDIEDSYQAKLAGFVRRSEGTSQRDEGRASGDATAATLPVQSEGIDTDAGIHSRNGGGANEKVDVKRPLNRPAESKGKLSVEVIDLASYDEEEEVGQKTGDSGRGNGSISDVGPGRLDRSVENRKQEGRQSGIPARKERREVLEIRKRRPR